MAALGIGSRTAPMPAVHVDVAAEAGDEARVLYTIQAAPIVEYYTSLV